MKKYGHWALLPFGIALALSGCGGSGSSSAGANNPSIPTAAIQITSSSANTVAGNSVGASQGVTQQGGSTSSQVVGAVTQGTGHLPGPLAIATAEFNKAMGLPLPAATVAGVVQTQTWDCTTNNPASAGASNTMTISYNMAGSTFAAGDSFTVSFNNCAGSAGSTMNGSMGYVVNSLSGNLGAATSASFTATFGNLSTASATETVSINGDMTVAASKTSSTSTTSTISGNSLTVYDTVNSVVNGMKLTGYSLNYSDDTSNGAYSYSVNMTLASTVINGSITVATTTPFSGSYSLYSGNPTAGSMTVSGLNGSYVTVTAVSDGLHAIVSGNDGSANFGPSTVLWTSL